MTITGIGNYTGSVEMSFRIWFSDSTGDGIVDSRDLIAYYYGQSVLAHICRLPADLVEIESGAFADTDFEVLILPKNLRTVSEDAFGDGLIVVIPDESWVSWAAGHGYEYRVGID